MKVKWHETRVYDQSRWAFGDALGQSKVNKVVTL